MTHTNLIALNNDQLMRHAPSIFTMNGAKRTSDKYQHISTIEVIEGLRSEGFMPVWATQSNARTNEKKLHTKHMMRFRHIDAQPTDGGLFQELVLINSHDGLSSYKLMAGIYRMVCSNGLIAGDTYNEVRVRHQGDIIGNVIEGTYEVMKSAELMHNSAQQMGQIVLDAGERQLFAEAAHAIKFDGNEEQGNAIKATQLIRPRRYQEVDKHDLFTTFNVAQENIIRGGLRGWGKDANGYHRRTTTREVKSIDQNNALNRALWTLAEKMAELKGQHIAA